MSFRSCRYTLKDKSCTDIKHRNATHGRTRSGQVSTSSHAQGSVGGTHAYEREWMPHLDAKTEKDLHDQYHERAKDPVQGVHTKGKCAMYRGQQAYTHSSVCERYEADDLVRVEGGRGAPGLADIAEESPVRGGGQAIELGQEGVLHPVDDKLAERYHEKLLIERRAHERSILLPHRRERAVNDDEEHHDDNVYPLGDVLARDIKEALVVHPLENEALHLHKLIRHEQRKQALVRCIQGDVQRNCLDQDDRSVHENRGCRYEPVAEEQRRLDDPALQGKVLVRTGIRTQRHRLEGVRVEGQEEFIHYVENIEDDVELDGVLAADVMVDERDVDTSESI